MTDTIPVSQIYDQLRQQEKELAWLRRLAQSAHEAFVLRWPTRREELEKIVEFEDAYEKAFPAGVTQPGGVT